MAARLATTNATDEEIAGLRRMFDEFRTEAPADHLEEYSDANIAFHQAIIQGRVSTSWARTTTTCSSTSARSAR